MDVEAKKYLERWREVEDIQREELLTTSLQERWRQLNALKLRALRLEISQEGDNGEMDVFLRWANLRKTYVTL